jgi:hypothetical protein
MTIPAADLLKLRSMPHQAKLYLVIQQPIWKEDGDWVTTVAEGGLVWTGTVAAPAPGTTNDEIKVTSGNATTLLDGMTVIIDSTETGGRDRGILKVHGDQTIAAGAGETLYISNSGELADVVVGDKVCVLDEFRYWPRYPKTIEAAGVLSWFKDWGYFRDSLVADGYTWAQLANSQAVYPPVPIMGPHRVHFIDPDVGSVNVDFDWSDSYTLSPGGATQAPWTAAGENGAGGWVDNAENPAAKTYTVLSGLAGWRTTLEVNSTVVDPIVEFRRGVRYVFTLRRPDQYQEGTDPTPRSHYVPIEDFEVGTISGDFASGSWSTSIRIFGSIAADYEIQPGALAIVFAEDWYAGTKESLGPIDGAENIVLVGHIADGTIAQDSETGDVTFDITSLAEQASRRENYPVPVTNDDTPTEWTDAQDLTVSRAAWWFTAWHSNLAQIADVFADVELDGVSDTREIAGQDFLAGDLFRASLDNFLQARVVGRVLMDRYERAAFVIDRQAQAAGGATTLFDLESGDWIGQPQLREINEVPANAVEAGGVNYNAGVITPYLSIAPGTVSGYIGTSRASNNLAVTGQAQLNTISGDLYAYANNKWPELILKMAGNWRFGDLWPQEYIDVDLTTVRYTLTNEDFLVRGVSFEFDPAQGTMFTTYRAEYETDGPDGVTRSILSELEPATGNTETPPEKPPGFGGVALVATGDGVWITYNLLDATPVWEELNDGLGASGSDARYVWSLVEDPNNPGEWWAATVGGIYYNDALLDGGTWVQLLSLTDIDGIATVTSNQVMGISFCALKPGYAAAIGTTTGNDLWVIDNNSNGASSTPADWRGRGIGGDTITGGQQIAVSYHLNAGATDIRCLLIGIASAGYLFLDDTGDTSGAFTNDVEPGNDVFPITFWESTVYDDDTGFLSKSDNNGVNYVQHTSAFLDLGPGTTVAKGDAAMVNGCDVHGVILWADILNNWWYVADESDIWISDDAGATWSTWGDDFSGTIDDAGAADGDTKRGFIVASVDSTEPASDIVILYDPDNSGWVDKTGNLDDDSAATSGYRIYLLDV